MILSDKNTNFISSIYETHLDNIKNVYKVSPQGKKPIMPLTNFIFEFFIFNSLYQIDWMCSCEKKTIIYQRFYWNQLNGFVFYGPSFYDIGFGCDITLHCTFVCCPFGHFIFGRKNKTHSMGFFWHLLYWGSFGQRF